MSSITPTARHDFVAVFSRAEDRAFVVGGIDNATSEPAGDIWFRGVDGEGEWEETPLGDFEVGVVLAATWSYVDHRLWVLDEVPAERGHAGLGGHDHDHHANGHSGAHDDEEGDAHGQQEHDDHAGHGRKFHGDHDGHGSARRARLYRVEPYLGVVQLVGDWPRNRSFEKHWLALDRDGQVLLFGSSAHAHAIARLEATAYEPLAALRVAFRNGSRALLLPPIVDELGYSFAYRGPGGGPQLERAADLDLHAAPLSALSGAL